MNEAHEMYNSQSGRYTLNTAGCMSFLLIAANASLMCQPEHWPILFTQEGSHCNNHVIGDMSPFPQYRTWVEDFAC